MKVSPYDNCSQVNKLFYTLDANEGKCVSVFPGDTQSVSGSLQRSTQAETNDDDANVFVNIDDFTVGENLYTSVKYSADYIITSFFTFRTSRNDSYLISSNGSWAFNSLERKLSP